MNSDQNKVDISELLICIYNTYRTALLNRKYYSIKLQRYQRYNSLMEVAIAIGATGNGIVASLAIWKSIVGQYLWLIIVAVATILSVIKPIIKVSRRVEVYANLYSGHTSIYCDLKHIVEDIAVSKSIPRQIHEKYKVIRQKAAELELVSEDSGNDRELIRKLQAEVNQEIPPQNLWIPVGGQAKPS